MRKKIDDALGNWETESIRVKQSIYEAKKNLQPMKTKRTSLIPYTMIAVVLAVTLGGFIIWQESGAKSGPVSSNNPPILGEIDTKTDTIPHEKTLQIIKYEYFYRYSSFISEKSAEYETLRNVMQTYPTFYHMEKYNYFFPKNREEHYRKRAAALFNKEMEDKDFKKYFTYINEHHGITEEDYIEHYLFVLEKFNFMQNEMYSKNIGLVEGALPTSEVEKEYEAIIGISLNELQNEVENEGALAKQIVATKIPNAPLQEHIPQLKYGYNKEGEIVIVEGYNNSESMSYQDLGWVLEGFSNFLYEKVYMNDYKAFEALPQLNRVNLHEYVTLLENFKGSPTQEANAKEALEFLSILQKSIELEVTKDFKLPR